MMTRAFIGVGSNISPEANIRLAMRLLARQVRLVAISTFYRTPAENRPEQPDYVNGVVAIETDLSPEALKGDVLRPIERNLGRRRTTDKSASRPIDLDILIFGSRQIRRPDLRLPADEIESRPFIAIPLAEVAPQLRVPGKDVPVSEMAARFSEAQLRPLAALTNELIRECGSNSNSALESPIRRPKPSRQE